MVFSRSILRFKGVKEERDICHYIFALGFEFGRDVCLWHKLWAISWWGFVINYLERKMRSIIVWSKGNAWLTRGAWAIFSTFVPLWWIQVIAGTSLIITLGRMKTAFPGLNFIIQATSQTFSEVKFLKESVCKITLYLTGFSFGLLLFFFEWKWGLWCLPKSQLLPFSSTVNRLALINPWTVSSRSPTQNLLFVFFKSVLAPWGSQRDIKHADFQDAWIVALVVEFFFDFQ